MRFNNKVVLVTGGAGGIGRAASQRFVKEGARVAVTDVFAERANAVATEIGNGAIGIAVDVTKRESIENMVVETARRLGPVDILFNNAGMWDMEPLLDVSEEQFDRLFAVNVKGFFFTMQAVAKQMVATGRRGAIVNTASQAGRRGEAPSAIYAATKATVISMTQSAALALIGKGIRVNAIAPGVVDTPMWAKVDAFFVQHHGFRPGQRTEEVRAAIPYGRLALPEEIASAAVYLASEDAEYIVGQTLNIDGGNVLS